MFDELKRAILDVIENPSSENLDTLLRVYNLYFVEPEEDQEYQNWRENE